MKRLWLILSLLCLTACGDSTPDTGGPPQTDSSVRDMSGSASSQTSERATTSNSSNSSSSKASAQAQIWQPAPLTSWQWQLSGDLNLNYPVQVYDIDLFESSTEIIAQIKNQGVRVVCYFSAGSYEAWRPDADAFPDAVLGNELDGWPDERWLDINSSVVRSVMQSRLNLAKEKGCDAVEPDNVEAYDNTPGLLLTAVQQLDYNSFLAREAHARGLAIGLKNDLDQIEVLQPLFDFAVNEQCFEYNECDKMLPFIEANKAVFNAEYRSAWRNNAGERNALCTQSVNMQISTLILPLGLDDEFRYSCMD